VTSTVNDRHWLRLIIGTLVVAVLGFYSWKNLEVTSDITHFLPEGRDRHVSELSRELADSELARTMIITVEAPDETIAVAASKALATDLKSDHDVAWLRSGVDENAEKDVYDTYFSRRFLFASDHPKDLANHLSDSDLAESARTLKRELASPLGPFVRAIAPRDPLLFFPKLLERLRAAQDDALHLTDEQFVSADGRHGVIFLATRAAPFDTESQSRFLSALDSYFERINAKYNNTLHLESSGVNRFTVSAEKSIRADIQRISTISTIGVVVLFLVVFRSIRYVLLGMIPLIAGTVAAIAVGILVFGKIHGLTLAFGSSLIGVGIDYAEHYFSHHTVSPDPDGPEASIRRIWPGLVIGALTTIAGLAGLAWTSFPGLREIAVFSTVGVIAALIATRVFLPPLMPWKPKPVPLQQWAARSLGGVLAKMMRMRRGVLIVPVVGILFCALGLPRVRWIDDISALNSIDPSLQAEDIRVRERVAKSDPGRFVLAVGDDDDHALAKNDEVASRLEQAKSEGTILGFHSMHAVLWSKDLQLRSQDAIARSPDIGPRGLSTLRRRSRQKTARSAHDASPARVAAQRPRSPFTRPRRQSHRDRHIALRREQQRRIERQAPRRRRRVLLGSTHLP
jgi:predicted exporter